LKKKTIYYPDFEEIKKELNEDIGGIK